jgi:glucosylceramidase
MLRPRGIPAQSSPENRQPSGEITVRVTAGAKRFALDAPLDWQSERGSPNNSILIDPGQQFQEILGFGASFTDAACYMFNQLSLRSRAQLFREFFHPSEMGFSACRICVGSSDYATKMYSFDEGVPDPELRRFSIDHDREYILPMLKLGRSVNPDLFLLATPWSPPGWMKAGGSMLGGSMRKKSFGVYARYLAKFIKAYSEAGVTVNALSVQNEVDTDQDGNMPACLWGQEYEMQFIADHLGPLFAKEKIGVKIWILDHNYSLWGRAICELDDPDVNRYVDGVAWHGYVGEVSAMTRVHQAHPEKHMYWTEGGPSYRDPEYQTDWTQWSATFAGILRNWARCIMGWNLALDEAGKPNIGPFDCGGVVTINSKTKEITRSGQYWALAHYSRAIRRGARRLESSASLEGVSHVAFANPDGTKAVVLTNAGSERKATLRMAGMETAVNLPADSITTLTWRA